MAWVKDWRFPFKENAFVLELDCTGDWQMGSSSCAVWKIDKYIDKICARAEFLRATSKITKTGMMLVGDLEDEDRPSTRAMRSAMSADRPEVVERDAVKHINYLESEIIPRLLKIHQALDYGIMGGVAGHHWTFLAGGAKVGEKTYYNSVEYMFARLEAITGKPCEYLGPMVSFLDFTFTRTGESSPKSVRQVGLLQHGEGGGQSKSSTIGRLERTAQGFDADFYIRGHDCQLVATKTDILHAKARRGGEVAEGAISSKTRTMLNLGSFTMGYEFSKGRSSYVEQGMMRPLTMGSGGLIFEIRKASRHEDPNGNYLCETFARI